MKSTADVLGAAAEITADFGTAQLWKFATILLEFSVEGNKRLWRRASFWRVHSSVTIGVRVENPPWLCTFPE